MMLEEMTETISLVSFSGRVASQVFLAALCNLIKIAMYVFHWL